jgi:SNF2 family DNA or RNA helicase
MKTKPMDHQRQGLARMQGREHFALFAEQGTGKTWMFLADAERLYAAGKIDSLLIVAPKGVHINWIRREIPAHLEAPHIAAFYASGASKRQQRLTEAVFAPRDVGYVPLLRVLSINVEALITKAGRAVAERLLRATRCMMVIDESSRIKNPTAERTKVIHRLGLLAAYRRIGTGTPITNSPVDAFAQFEFLESGLLGTTSYRSFVAEYAELLPPNNNLVKHIRGNNANAQPQIVARDAMGRPKWRNLDKLQSLIEPHSYRVLKKDCLDLPEKLYTTRYFQLTPALRRAYDELDANLRIELDGETNTVTALGALVKLQQITSGFVMIDGVTRLLGTDDNPRMEALLDVVDDTPEQFIVWARFREELQQIADALRARGITAVEYHGGVSTKARDVAVDSFQSGQARAFVGQPQSGGIGLTLTAARHVIYYSNDFNLETRLQSEDRAHRIGTKEHVLYTDLAAVETLDEAIARSLQFKQNLASTILGDYTGRHRQVAFSEPQL